MSGSRLRNHLCPDRFGPFIGGTRPYQQRAWFDRKARPWLADAPATHKLLTWGNHDWCGQTCSFREDSPAHARSTDLQILVDEGTTIPRSDGTSGHVSVWATPWSNKFMRRAFMKKPSELEAIYAAIPEGTDVLVSHQPPSRRLFAPTTQQLRLLTSLSKFTQRNEHPTAGV